MPSGGGDRGGAIKHECAWIVLAVESYGGGQCGGTGTIVIDHGGVTGGRSVTRIPFTQVIK